MGETNRLSAFWRAQSDRRAARAACRLARKAPPLPGFQLMPEPLALGQYARGRQIASGQFRLCGELLELAPGSDPFAAIAPSPRFREALHGFGWLDDLAAAGDHAARAEAQRLTALWWAGHGEGQGLGWRPDLAGRRLSRWLMQAEFLLAGSDPAPLLAAMAAHLEFLRRRAADAAPGLPRIEALSGRALGALLLAPPETGPGHEGALPALALEAGTLIGPDGGIASRNPEELLEIAARLGWVLATAERLGSPETDSLREALARAAMALRLLRHSDGGLARFHGGGAGLPGTLERSLALARRASLAPREAMGFARLEAGRSSVIIDAAPPPEGEMAREAHASTLAFELTSGRRPVIVSCGSGLDFGPQWRAASRATLSHSTLSLDGWSSSRMAGEGGLWRRLLGRSGGALTDRPRQIGFQRQDESHASAIELTHDGWLRTHGLTHTRRLDLSRDGRALLGEDSLTALAAKERERLEEVLAATPGKRPGFTLRFHLHPDSEAALEAGGAVIELPSGELWAFGFEGEAHLALEPSVWLEPGRRAPRASQQIVLRAQVSGPAQRLNWTLTKAQDTPRPIRDIGDTGDEPLFAHLTDRD